MKIRIRTDYLDDRQPFRRLSVAAVQDAMRRLSHDGLKLWLTLAMNKNDYADDYDINRQVYDELKPWIERQSDGSHIFSATGQFFTDIAEQEQTELPREWCDIQDDYGNTEQSITDAFFKSSRAGICRTTLKKFFSTGIIT